jgi:hypothetical protein
MLPIRFKVNGVHMMHRVLVFAFTFFVCGMALAQSETPLVPKKPISVSFEDVAVVRVLEIDSKPMIAVAKFVPKETVATTKKRGSSAESVGEKA